MGEMGKDFCSKFIQTLLENIDRRSCNDGSQEHIPVSPKMPTLFFGGGLHFGVGLAKMFAYNIPSMDFKADFKRPGKIGPLASLQR